MYLEKSVELHEAKKKKWIELQGEIDESSIIIRDFNTSLSEMRRSSRHKIRENIVEHTKQQTTGYNGHL